MKDKGPSFVVESSSVHGKMFKIPDTILLSASNTPEIIMTTKYTFKNFWNIFCGEV